MSEHTGHRERLRRRADKTKLAGFQPHEVLELLLMETIPRRDVNPLAHALIQRFGSFSAVLDATREELMQVDGVGQRTADHLTSQPDIFAYYMQDRWTERAVTILTSAEACDYCTTIFGRQREEALGIVCLDTRGAVISQEIITTGTINETAVYPRQIAELALRMHASAVIMVHNHPSGNLQPSRGDVSASLLVRNALEMLEIKLMDHILVAGPQAISFVRSGLLPPPSEKGKAQSAAPILFPKKAKKTTLAAAERGDELNP